MQVQPAAEVGEERLYSNFINSLRAEETKNKYSYDIYEISLLDRVLFIISKIHILDTFYKAKYYTCNNIYYRF